MSHVTAISQSADAARVADRYRGTFRVSPPHRTWARIEPLLRRAGITRLVDHTGLDPLGIPVYGAVRPGARCQHHALGKGVTAELSRISAAMEGIEVWHAEEVLPDLTDTSTTTLHARGETLLGPDALAGPGQSPGPSVRLSWVRGRRLSDDAETWVPHDTVRLTACLPRLLMATTNGLASGNTYDEAVLHALLELAERDAVAAYAATHACRRIRLDTVDDTETGLLLERYLAAGFEVMLLDVTNDLEVPTVVAYVRGPDLDWVFCGAGAHLNLAVAASRALTEAAQLRLIVALGLRDDVDDRFDVALEPRRPFTASFPPASVAFASHAADELRSIGDDIELVRRSLAERRGIDPVVVDLTRPDTGLPVVKALAPGAATDLTFFGPRPNLPFGATS